MNGFVAVLKSKRLNARSLFSLLALTFAGWVMPVHAQPVPPSTAAELYRIGAGDTLRVTVYQSPDLSLEARVTEAGIISYPLLGRIKLGGLTVNEAEAAMASALLKGDFVKNAQVIIAVTQVRANQVNVLGHVSRPGRIPLDVAGMRITEILALAGGIVSGGNAGSDTVVLVGQREGKPFRREIDLPGIFTASGRGDDLVVMPGDTVWVDRAPQIYLYGEVQRPGQQRLERGMTVMQALAMGGGITQRGTLKGLRVTRRGGDGRVQTLEPTMEDTLRDGDVMFVRESLF
jgi:polysaccharide export outer membrane protein